MYAVALTSIPPRLARLGPVLASLLAQEPAPERVLLCLPEAWRRFPGPVAVPALPDGVELVTADADFGPATKAIAPARALTGHIDHLIYCDDDWLMPPGWASALLTAQRPGEAVAASGWSVDRLKRQSTAKPGCVDIAQGFSGVLIDPRWLAGEDLAPPPEAWAVDGNGYPVFPVGRGWEGERRREMAYRFGINLIMYVLTGNYKSDQVHVPALLDRLRGVDPGRLLP